MFSKVFPNNGSVLIANSDNHGRRQVLFRKSLTFRIALQVVQVYMSWENATVPVPQRTLVSFDRIHVAAGQTGHMTSTILAHQMAVWKNDKEGFVVEPGK